MMNLKSAYLFFAAFLTVSINLGAQIYEPVKWKFSSNSINDTESEIIATATIEAGWHVYATKVAANEAELIIKPVATEFILTKSPAFEKTGSVNEGKFIKHMDPQFEAELYYFENKATFKQKIKHTGDKPFKVEGEIVFMACNDQVCIPPASEFFQITVTPMGAADGAVTPIENKVENSPSEATVSAEENTLDHVSWSFFVEQKGGAEYDLVMKAVMENGWHIYAQKLEGTEGPVPTTFKFEPLPSFALSGEVKEGKPIREYDKNFMMNIDFFEGNAEFRQLIKLNGEERPIIEGVISFMQCNDQRCLPPKNVNVKFDVANMKAYAFDPLMNAEATDLKGNDPFKMQSVDLNAPINNCGKETENHSLWAIFLFGIIGGLVALLTPCVFPMIPLTVSFFTKGSEKGRGKQRAITYGFFIFLIYFLLSLPFHLSKNVDPEVLNSIATNSWLNLGFFVVFIFFAISFFGYFEITLPSGLANKVDNASNVGGSIGIFFMALTLAIVSFSCTGPILGTVIGSIYSTDVQGTFNLLGLEMSMPAAKVSAAMIGFGIALGFPFALFAAFPGLLKKLPKSGGWMDDFKVSLGFLEVALAIKFLSNADLVQQWGILKRETFFTLWIIVGALWFLYMVGLFKFKPGQGSKGMPKFKLVFTVLIACFTLRMIPGVLPSSSLNRFDFLSGFPPPKSYSWYHFEEEFKIYKDLAEAMKVAEAEGKPVFVDFTGWACVNCRKMEDTVWPQEVVKSLLAGEFIMCSLYVDEKVKLPESEQFIYTTENGRKKKIEDVGDKWATLQTETFLNNSQPMYALLSEKGRLLAPIEQYNDNVEEYVAWLKCGLEAYKSTKSEASIGN